MSGFGIRKNNTGKAIIRFLIGLLIVAVCVLLMYELVLKGDFRSDKPVEGTVQLGATVMPTGEYQPSIIKGNTLNASTPEEATPSELFATPVEPFATPDEPEATPTPVPTATPKPAPTPIPEEEMSKIVTTFGQRGTAFNKTKFSTDKSKINVGVTEFEVSAGDAGKAISLAGWAYANDEKFDGAKSDVYVIVLNSKNQIVFYEPVIVPGITGNVLEGKGKNLDQCEFTANIDVSWYYNDDYRIGAGVVYKTNKEYRYAFTFGDAYNFTIVDGVVSAIGGKEVS